MSKTLKIATAQFEVSANIKRNRDKIIKLIIEASEQSVEVIHFSECCLSGYPSIDFIKCFNDPEITSSLSQIRAQAAASNIWVIIGTHYYQSLESKPFNSLLVFNNKGEEVCRYNKRILAGSPNESDQAHFQAGSNASYFFIKGIKCSLVICHEWRYPEIFRECHNNDVQVVFHSFYDGNLSNAEYHATGEELGELIMGSQRGNAANNYLWLSSSNTCKSEQVYPSSLIRPDGSIQGRATRNKEGVIISEINLDDKFIDPSYYGRKRLTDLFPKNV